MGPIKESALDLTVTDLLTSELKWNKARIEKLLPEFIDQIRCIQPSSLGAQDTVIWNRTKFEFIPQIQGTLLLPSPRLI